MTRGFVKLRGQRTKSAILILLALSVVLPQALALTWQGPVKVPMIPSLNIDGQVKFVDAAPSPGAALKVDPLIKYVEKGIDTNWDPGESVLYDVNGNGAYDSGEPVISGQSPVAGTLLRVDGKIKIGDVNSNNSWDPGEPVVWDSNGNNTYDSGEYVVAGTPPPAQAVLTSASRIRFIDSNSNGIRDPGERVVYDSSNNGFYNATIDPKLKFVDQNSNNAWNSGEPVVYDTNNNNIYDAGEPVVAGNPSPGASLKSDSHFKYADTSHDFAWELGEAVVYDNNSNAVYDQGDAQIAGYYPPLQSVLTKGVANQTAGKNRITFFDSNGNNLWNQGEAIVWDSNNNNSFSNSTDPKIMFYDPDNNGVFDSADTVIYDANGNGMYEGLGGSDPYVGAIGSGGLPNAIDCPCPLRQDSHFRFVDARLVGTWVAGDTVTYDSNNNNIYDSGEMVITGTPPPVGTLMAEPVIAGPTPTIGAPLKIDPRFKFVDSNFDGVWSLGEAVIYDGNNNALYDTGDIVAAAAAPRLGTLLSEPVILGPPPAIGSALQSDPKIRFIDSNGNAQWDSTEVAVYDSNNNSRYDTGEPVIAGGATGDGHWDPGKVVVYDTNTNGKYDTDAIFSEPVVAGSAPVNGTPLSTDQLIKFIDSNGNLLWDSGEVVVYDSNGNTFYDTGEPVIAGQAPATKFVVWPAASADQTGKLWLAWYEKTAGTTQGWDVYFKLWNGAGWTNKQQVTTDTHNDTTESITLLSNQTMMIVWASDRAGTPHHPQLFYKLYSTAGAQPTALTGDIQLTTSNSLFDSEPSAVQDRAGRIWVAWTRHDSKFLFSDIYYKYFNGTSWSGDFPVPTASGSLIQERSPSIAQSKDGRIWVAFASNNTSGGHSNIFATATDGTTPVLPSTGIPLSSWSSTATPLFSSTDEDEHPSIVQSGDGIIWVFYHKSVITTPPDSIYAGSSSNNGASWSSTTFTPGPNDSTPAATLLSGSLWVFWDVNSLDVWYKTSNRIGVHDIGVRTLTWVSAIPKWLPGHVVPPASPGIIRSGDSINITAAIQNYGNYTEQATLTLKLNSTVLTPTPVSLTLPPYNITTVRFSWNSSLAPVKPFWGRYVLTATLVENAGLGVELPINQADNNVNGWLVRVSPPGDVDGNGKVNILDAAIAAFEFDSFASDPNSKYWLNPNADIDHNRVVNILDISILAFHFGEAV